MIDWLLEPEEDINPSHLLIEQLGTDTEYVQTQIRRDYNG